MPLKYHEQMDRDNTLKLRGLLQELPPFCRCFFRAIEPRTSSRTRIAYAYDLRVFFQFLSDSVPELSGKPIEKFVLSDIADLPVLRLEEYMEYLKYRVREQEKLPEDRIPGRKGKGRVEILNHERSIKRKISSLKSFYKYLYRDQLISEDTASLLILPKLREREIIRLDENEVADLLDTAESGEKLTERQQRFHEKTALRDTAILSLMLGTGIRVSECVGLNIQDLDLNSDGIRIHRKGGKEVTVYFSDEVERILSSYLKARKKMAALSGSEDALFLSLQKKRIGVRAVENMVKKYASAVTPLKHITPHKLRSTYGTNLYRETGDIYLVADVLGHEDVNTTKKHYAALEEERRRSARNRVHLRED